MATTKQLDPGITRARAKASRKGNRDVVELEQFRRGMLSSLGSTERIRRLTARSRSTPQTICLHRARAYTTVFDETEGEPLVLRRAKALKKTLEDLPCHISEDELIVGKRACRLRCVPIVPECHGGWLQWDLETLPTRKQDPFNVPPEQMAEARELLGRWKGRTLYDAWSKACPEETASKVTGTGWADASAGLFMLGYHFTPPWERILGSGLRSFEEETRARLASLEAANPEHMGREHFLNALLIVIGAVKRFAHSYAEEASRLAKGVTGKDRKQELLQIAEACRRVPYSGARSFFEAMQSLWFIHLLLYIEGTGPSYCLGRFDQYMYPFFKADLERNALNRQGAQELIEHLYINLTDNLSLYDSLTVENAAGFTQYQTLSIGGIDSSGNDASNELSYLCLDAAKSVRSTQPDIVLLCHPRETPYELKMKAVELVQIGMGLPKFISTETTKVELMELGYSREEASQGWIRGCSEPYGPGSKQYGHTAAAFLNVPLSLEALLFRGRKRMVGQNWSGRKIGLDTGDPVAFETFESFVDAFKKQMAAQIRDAHIAGSYMEMAQAHYFPLVLQSILTDGCIERGLAANAGGARINVGPGCPFTGGWATVADSLAAVKKLVYEEKKIDMAQLIAALEANFEGWEHVQRLLIEDAPKFGNDIDYVDNLAREVFQFASAEVKKYIGPFGNRNSPGTAVSVSHISHGKFVWATPDGRKAGTPLSDNVGPMEQRDKEGPVAHINSVTKLGLERQFGTIHNMYITNADTEEKKHKVIALIDAYHGRGGHHIQINCIDKDILSDAQEHPEKYPTLMVRVAGYVAYFVELSRNLQNYIIARTSLNV
jgi:pyruvate formate-lyase/glycerol dehydratase family glycyl radical enzyme